MKTTRIITTAITASTLLLVSACEAPVDDSAAALGMNAAEQLATEYGADVEVGAVDKVISLSKPFTVESRGAGVDTFIAALSNYLKARRKDPSSLASIHDMNLGEPLPGVGEYFVSEGDVSTTSQALGSENPNVKYFECPPAGAKTGAESCAEIIDTVLVQVQRTVNPDTFNSQAEANYQSDDVLRGQPLAFQDYSVNYLADLARRVFDFGVQVAAIRAEYTLRDAGVCDNEEISGTEIAKLRGEQDGETILREMIGRGELELAPQGGECLRIGQTGPRTDAKIRTAVDRYVTANPLCLDMARTNPEVLSAEEARRAGIERALKAHTTTIFVGVIRTDKNTGAVTQRGKSYTVVVVDGCTPKDQVTHTTSPLVIDLDNDGLQLSTDRVRFDLLANGKPQQVTWTGKREGLLTLDLDGNGRVTSGRELFGNRSECEGRKCKDGAEALAQHDSNDDNRIDARDGVFDRLQVWVDANHDGRSQPSELSSLGSHGITALSLAATYVDERVEGGRISLTMKVETVKGTRTAYDVWFDNLVSPGFPAPIR